MSEERVLDDASHYEVSMTATQAFVAFVLLLLSLAAAFAFGIMVGRGNVSDRLVVQREPSVISEGLPSVAPDAGKIVELDGRGENPDDTGTTPSPAGPEPTIVEEGMPATVPEGTIVNPASQPAPEGGPAPAPATTPHVAQLISTTDAAAAESLAARLIDSGFPSAYVQRSQSGRGTVYRVRVRFASEADARAALDRLGTFTKGEIWVTPE